MKNAIKIMLIYLDLILNIGSTPISPGLPILATHVFDRLTRVTQQRFNRQLILCI